MKGGPCLIACHFKTLLNTEGFSQHNSQTISMAQGEEEMPPPQGIVIFSQRYFQDTGKGRHCPSPSDSGLEQPLQGQDLPPGERLSGPGQQVVSDQTIRESL